MLPMLLPTQMLLTLVTLMPIEELEVDLED